MVRGLAPPTRPSPRESRSGRVRGRTPGHGASSDPRIALRLRQTPRQPSASGAVRRRRRGAMGGLDGPFRLVSTCSLDGHPLSDISSSRLGERCPGPTRCPALPTRTGSRAGRPKAEAIRSPEGQSLRPTASSRTRWRGMVANTRTHATTSSSRITVIVPPPRERPGGREGVTPMSFVVPISEPASGSQRAPLLSERPARIRVHSPNACLRPSRSFSHARPPTAARLPETFRGACSSLEDACDRRRARSPSVSPGDATR